MSYLKFLRSLEGYNTIEKLVAGDDELVRQGLSDLYKKTPADGDLQDLYAPVDMRTARDAIKDDPTSNPNWFEDQSLLYFPSDLFGPGNTAYVYFQIKDSANQTLHKGEDGSQLLNPDNGSQAAPSKRIALYMPPSIKIGHNSKWEDASLTIRKDIGVGKALLGAGKGGVEEWKQIVGQLGAKVADVVTGAEDAFINDAQFASKKIFDPQAALLFKGMDFREFQLDFQLMARNEEETDAIREIIKTFKYAMHPGQSDGGGTMWNYPYFFEIYLCTPSRKYMFNIMNSALTAMEVDYGGSGVPSFFRANGAPVDIRMSLQFKELYVLTKDMILRGF
jgi:hypothetical protein